MIKSSCKIFFLLILILLILTIHYYQFEVRLYRRIGSFNTINDLSNKVCVPNKTQDLNLSVLNMIAGINESKILTKHISCKCKYRFDEKECNSEQ